MAGQLWGTNNLGGFLSSAKLSKVLRHAVKPMTKFRQLTQPEDAVGKNKGNKFHWDVFSRAATKGAALTEGTAIPETNFVITQGELVITEYGNSVPFSGKLDNLSELPVKSIIQNVMKTDASETLDDAAYAQFNATPLVVSPTGGTSTSAITLVTNGTPTIINNVALGKDHVKAIVDVMKERNIPTYMGNDYVAVGRPTAFRQLKNDLEALHQYTNDGFTMILAGEIGRYEGVRFVEQTNIAAESWSNGKSSQVHFMGADRVAEGIAIPEEVRGKIPSDYGRSMGVAWYYLGGFGLVHSDATQARIVKWGSAS
jgi:N4-gp56 family major capsid protein